MDFYNVMASELNMDRTFETKGEFLIEFKRLILKAASSHRRVLMIIDESHRLSSPLLEEIRLLSNIDLDGKVLINTFFVGQLEFKALIARPENRAVRQRITVSYELLPLTLDETQQYIAHRLKVAGASRPIFTPEAIRLVHDLLPRLPAPDQHHLRSRPDVRVLERGGPDRPEDHQGMRRGLEDLDRRQPSRREKTARCRAPAGGQGDTAPSDGAR